jgi:hypothetical protein
MAYALRRMDRPSMKLMVAFITCEDHNFNMDTHHDGAYEDADNEVGTPAILMNPYLAHDHNLQSLRCHAPYTFEYVSRCPADSDLVICGLVVN